MGSQSIALDYRWKLLLGISLILALFLAVIMGINASAAPDGTEVGGDITSDTTWTLAGSPYIVINNLRVTPSATLTIQPGVEVRFRINTRLRVEGQLLAQGNPANLIKFTSETTTGYPGYWSGIFFKNTGGASTPEGLLEAGGGNILQYCIVEYTGVTDGAVRIENSAVLVDHCTVRNNSAGGILVVSNPDPGLAVGITFNDVSFNQFAGDGAGIRGIRSTITDNKVTNNSSGGSGAGIYAQSSTVRDNIVGFNTAVNDGGGIYSNGSFISGNFVHDNKGDEAGGIYSHDDLFFSGNTVVRNHSGREAAGVYYIGTTSFSQNTVVDNTTTAGFAYGGVVLQGTPVLNFNNYYANEPFDFIVQTGAGPTINGENNFWGTTDTGTILGRIFDANDDSGRALFDFQPFLFDATSPLPPPLDLQGAFTPTTVNLSWSGLPGTSTVYGYKVYYDSDGMPPYDGTGLNEGDSPIDVLSQTNVQLTGLDAGIVVVVTAYDQVSQESWYSNKVDNLSRVYVPVVIK